MNFPPELLALGFILFFGAIVFLAFRASSRQQAEKYQQITTLGFEAPESPPHHLQSRVEDLFRTQQGRELVLQHVYHRRELDRELYLFDVIDTQGENSELAQEVFGVISPQLALPRFALTAIPKFDRGSLIGGLMDQLLDKVLSLAGRYLDLQRVEFPERPEYNDRFVAFGQDPQAVRDLLDHLPLSRLVDFPLPLQIAGSGDFLTVDYSVSASYNDEKLDLISQYRQFTEIIQIFI